MRKSKILHRNKLFELYGHLNRENRANDKAVVLREIDLTQIDILRLRFGQRKISYTVLIMKAAAQTLNEFPRANRISIDWLFWKRIVQLNSIDVSVAVEREDAGENTDYEAAFIYTVYDTNEKDILEVSNEIQGLAKQPLNSKDPRLERWQRMKAGIQTSPFLWPAKIVVWLHRNIPFLYYKNRGGSLMISSPGKYGVDAIVAHWPYTLGLSFGLAKPRPWVQDGKVEVKKTFHVTLAFDRRIVSGSLAARFMNRLCDLLESPDWMEKNLKRNDA